MAARTLEPTLARKCWQESCERVWRNADQIRPLQHREGYAQGSRCREQESSTALRGHSSYMLQQGQFFTLPRKSSLAEMPRTSQVCRDENRCFNDDWNLISQLLRVHGFRCRSGSTRALPQD